MGMSAEAKERKRRYKNRVRYDRHCSGFCIDCPRMVTPKEEVICGGKLPWRCNACQARFNERERCHRLKKRNKI